jgi:hypothetical protein
VTRAPTGCNCVITAALTCKLGPPVPAAGCWPKTPLNPLGGVLFLCVFALSKWDVRFLAGPQVLKSPLKNWPPHLVGARCALRSSHRKAHRAPCGPISQCNMYYSFDIALLSRPLGLIGRAFIQDAFGRGRANLGSRLRPNAMYIAYRIALH